jgi:hypothetical protein
MTIADASPEGTTADVERVRLRLLKAADELRPIEGPTELHARLMAAAREVHSIQEALRLLLHVTALEETDFLAELDAIDEKLADGSWRPEGSKVEDVVARLAQHVPRG